MATAARKTPSPESHAAIPIEPGHSQRVPARSTFQEQGRRGTVLVVDDEPAVRQLVVTILEGEGFSCVAACDGLDALDVFARSPGAIDFLLSDVAMPRMDGLELASRVAVARPTIGILIMSGHLQNRSLQREWRFLAKPFRTSELLDRMGELEQSR
jgi:CheY-like chemotaxis protein